MLLLSWIVVATQQYQLQPCGVVDFWQTTAAKTAAKRGETSAGVG